MCLHDLGGIVKCKHPIWPNISVENLSFKLLFSSVLETYPSKLSETNGTSNLSINWKSQNQSRWRLLFPQALWTQFFWAYHVWGPCKNCPIGISWRIHSKLQFHSIAKISSGAINSIEEKCNPNESVCTILHSKEKAKRPLCMQGLNSIPFMKHLREHYEQKVFLESNNLFQKQSALRPHSILREKNSIYFTQPLISPKWWFRHSAFK